MKQLLADFPNNLGQLLVDCADGFTYAPDLGYVVHWDTEKDGPLPDGAADKSGYLKRDGGLLVEDTAKKSLFDARKAAEAAKALARTQRREKLKGIDLSKNLSAQEVESLVRDLIAEARGD